VGPDSRRPVTQMAVHGDVVEEGDAGRDAGDVGIPPRGNLRRLPAELVLAVVKRQVRGGKVDQVTVDVVLAALRRPVIRAAGSPLAQRPDPGWLSPLSGRNYQIARVCRDPFKNIA
jgi:hypothetical protein